MANPNLSPSDSSVQNNPLESRSSRRGFLLGGVAALAAGAVAACGGNTVKATPEFPSSSATATPEAPGSGSTDASSGAPSTEVATPDASTSPSASAEKSSETPTASADVLGAEPRYSHPEMIEAREYIDNFVGKLYEFSYADLYLRTGQTRPDDGTIITRSRLYGDAADFQRALGQDGVINYDDADYSTSFSEDSPGVNPAFASAPDVLEKSKKDGGADGSQLLVEYTFGAPLSYALAQKKGSTTVTEADFDNGVPLDNERSQAIFFGAFGQLYGRLGEQAHQEVGIDGNATNKLADTLFAMVRDATTVSYPRGLTIENVPRVTKDNFYQVEIYNTNLGEEKELRTFVDIPATINGEDYILVFTLDKSKKPIGTTQKSPNRENYDGSVMGEYYEMASHSKDGQMLSTKTGEVLETAVLVGVKSISGGVR